MDVNLKNIELIVIGVSAGGIKALSTLFKDFSSEFPIPIVVVQHISSVSENYLVTHLNRLSKLTVVEAEEKVLPKKAHVYIAPPNYHLLIDVDRSLALSTEEKVSYARPSIDVLFTSASYAYENKLLAIVLTGANNDSLLGAKSIKKYGGKIIVQNPKTAEVATMPEGIVNAKLADGIMTLEEMSSFLQTI